MEKPKVKWYNAFAENDGEEFTSGTDVSESVMQKEIDDYIEEESFSEDLSIVLIFKTKELHVERLIIKPRKTTIEKEILI